jgi:septum formation protein
MAPDASISDKHGWPAEDAAQAREYVGRLNGRTHEVVSGLCLLTRAWEEVAHETTSVTFRTLTPRDIAHYLHQGEWRDRAGAYAIQGLGGRLVERIEGDYLNVVGLPGALLVSILEERAPNLLQTRR